jgi:hypothetical protein
MALPVAQGCAQVRPYWNENALVCQGVSNIFAAQPGTCAYLFGE